MTQGFHEVSLPLRLALGASGGPARRTDIVALSNGGETRNARWADSRRRYDVGTGIRSIEDLYALTAFFEARRGQLYGFRFRDPVDHASAAPGAPIAATDQEIGIGDGETSVFQLIKHYGETKRIIGKPVAGSVLVAVDGVAIDAADVIADETSGEIIFEAGAIPAAGAIVSAGYAFDIPVRFDADRIEVNLAAFRAGSAPTVPLVEIRP
ncbi:TIGR02217 family protein [Pseudohoeflea suaedae]|uniref:TIGR02217 family protein n=1 Tax=Pseudohoeflea suaedae TaxID=877384 RepID=A0A4R5PPQ7_9HYPH|nr:DUF2460 domain-containing protein [Pseudohoeflea suaedae]TDH38853.1 TIGR02217 family protein [Pseudohoeflea suaedae]